MTLSLLRRSNPDKPRFVVDASGEPVMDGNGLWLGLLTREEYFSIKEIREEQQRALRGDDVGLERSGSLLGGGLDPSRIAGAPLKQGRAHWVGGHLKLELLFKAFAEAHRCLLRRGDRS